MWDYAVYMDDSMRQYSWGESFPNPGAALHAAVASVDISLHRVSIEVFQNDGETLFVWSARNPLVLEGWGTPNIPLVPAE